MEDYVYKYTDICTCSYISVIGEQRNTIYIHVYVHMYSYMHGVIYYIYISNWQILQDCVYSCIHVYMYMCVCVYVCILAKEGISKNNITQVNKRIRVKSFHRRIMKVKSLVYSK